jgi:RNA polymerase sigma-70 factor (ECF subfamily)
MKDCDIVRRVLDGEREAYAEIVRRHQARIHAMALRMVRDPQEAADLTQDIFLRAYERLWRFDTERRFSSWLYALGMNVVRNHLGKRKRDVLVRAQTLSLMPPLRGSSPEGGAELERSQTNERLEAAMGRLPDATRDALVLRYFLELPIDEVAETMGVSLSAAKMRIYRGLEKLQAIYNGDAEQ